MISRRFMNGSVALEAAICIPIILFVIILWAELCFLFYSISSNEHAFANAVFYAKKIDMNNHNNLGNYSEAVQSKLRDYGGKLWGASTVPSSLEISVNYFQDYDALQDCSNSVDENIDNCQVNSTDYRNGAIAIYSLSYIHQPLSLTWFPNIKIKREIIAVQEYERCEISALGKECE